MVKEPRKNSPRANPKQPLIDSRCASNILSCAQEQYAESEQPLQDLFECLCQDLRSAFLDGVELMDGSKLHLCPIGVKGDWPFLASWLFKYNLVVLGWVSVQ